MKSFSRLFWTGAMFSFTVLFTGCDLLDKADDVTFDAVIDADWNADENADGTDVPYTDTRTIDLSGNAEIAKYINKIKEVKINKVTYLIANYNAAPHNTAVMFKDGVASFSATMGGTPIVTVPYAASASGVNLQGTTSETTLNIDAAGLENLAKVFKDSKEVQWNTSGVLSRVPVSFTVKSKFYLTITASALD